MTILRSGSTKKYSENWASAFGKKKSKSKAVAKQKSTKKTKSTKKSKKK